MAFYILIRTLNQLLPLNPFYKLQNTLLAPGPFEADKT